MSNIWKTGLEADARYSKFEAPSHREPTDRHAFQECSIASGSMRRRGDTITPRRLRPTAIRILSISCSTSTWGRSFSSKASSPPSEEAHSNTTNGQLLWVTGSTSEALQGGRHMPNQREPMDSCRVRVDALPALPATARAVEAAIASCRTPDDGRSCQTRRSALHGIGDPGKAHRQWPYRSHRAGQVRLPDHDDGNGDELQFNESRDGNSASPITSNQLPMLVTNGFSTLLLIFHPYYRNSFNFESDAEDVVNGSPRASSFFPDRRPAHAGGACPSRP